MNVNENTMANENINSRSYPMNGLRICIDRGDNTLAGRIYSKMSKQPISFESCSKMLLKADGLFDEKGYPQRFTEPRNFRNENVAPSSFHYPEAEMPDQELLKQEGKCCTLDVFVQSRRKAGWQGVVMEPDGNYISEFKSELELLMILGKEIKKQEREG